MSVLEGYLALDGIFEKGSFTRVERQLILLAASVENKCGYCTAAHSTIAKGFLHAAPEIVSAIRNGSPIADKKTNTLVNLTREIVRGRGFVKQETIEAFLSAGYRREPGRRSENHLQLLGPHFAHSSRSGLRGGKGSLRSRTGPGPRDPARFSQREKPR